MRTIILLAIAATLGIFAPKLQAQERDNQEQTESLDQQKERIISQEKSRLRNEVESIMRRLEKNEITSDEAETLKKAAAEKAALNIENKIAILENKLALEERNPNGEDDGFKLNIGWGGANEDGDRTWGIHWEDDRPRKRKYDRRTTSDFVLAFGLNNVITEGQGLDNSPYQAGGSRFAELGIAWKTRVFKNTGWLRLKYGFSFQFNGLKPKNNQIFVKEGNQTVLQDFDLDLDKSKFRTDNLVIPVHFEIGPYKKKQGEDYVRYYTHNKFKIGIGGYAGVNLGARQKLKFDRDGDRIKEKQRGGFNTNDFVYGLSSYVSWGSAALYVKYDLNPIFENNAVEQRNVSLGVRFDMD